MNKHLILLIAICFSQHVFSQVDSTVAYLRYPTIPYFTITKVPDSSKFARINLDKKKSTIIFIFSPDCGHCQQKIKELTSNINLFKKVQLVMASPLEYRIIKKFYEEYHIADYPNIIMGSDPGYFLGTFYNIKKLPAIFLYDKKLGFVKSFDGNTAIADIVAAL